MSSSTQSAITYGQTNMGDVPPSQESQTASEYIDSQLKLEADAREALPYSFKYCTQSLGPLRQNLYACLTCHPPPTSVSDSYVPAGVCYACSIVCHGEHTLVELFTRRNFVCDCGTTRLPAASPCTLRIDPASGLNRPVHSQEPAKGNTYNKNFRNRFCGCEERYDAEQQKGTMFQCLGLATEEQGGCGEDWWHPECLMGLERDWRLQLKPQESPFRHPHREDRGGEQPVPMGFPDEDDFDALICYKCVDAAPWLKRYANTDSLRSVSAEGELSECVTTPNPDDITAHLTHESEDDAQSSSGREILPKKREREDSVETGSQCSKRVKTESDPRPVASESITSTCKAVSLPPQTSGKLSLFLSADFRDHLCRCRDCYPLLRPYPQLLDEEEAYEPPVSEDGDGTNEGGSIGTGSLFDLGEAALTNVDRVRAIEGVMAYNHLKEGLKDFFKPFAESGQAIGADDIKAYFEKLRGDADAIESAGRVAGTDDEDIKGGNRREQSGEYFESRQSQRYLIAQRTLKRNTKSKGPSSNNS